MHQHALRYAAIPKATPSQIKKSEVPEPSQEDLTRAQARLEKHNIDAIVDEQPWYHHTFGMMPSRPYIVYYQGDISLLNRMIMGIVWPRDMTSYGNKVLEEVFTHLPNYDVVTVSWLADGVDTTVHQLSIQNNIPTIAVLGGWFHHFFNSPRRQLIEHIVAAGWLVLTEFKPQQEPTHYTFPQRNRIIAGLSQVLFIPEARKNSGSLITVDFALQMHKPVYGAPSSIFSPQSQGIHEYMQRGSIRPIADIPERLDSIMPRMTQTTTQAIQKRDLTPEQEIILQTIAAHAWLNTIDLVNKSGLELWTIIQHMTLLEMYGLILEDSPGIYISTQSIAN